MRTLKHVLTLPMIAALALSVSGCSVVQSLIGGTHSVDLAVGDCIKSLDSDVTGSDGQVGQVQVVDCSEPHLYEVYAEVELSGDSLPSATEVETEAEDACFGSGFEEYVGAPVTETEYVATYLSPSQDTWDAGDRKVTCVLSTLDESELTASAKDSAK